MASRQTPPSLPRFHLQLFQRLYRPVLYDSVHRHKQVFHWHEVPGVPWDTLSLHPLTPQIAGCVLWDVWSCHILQQCQRVLPHHGWRSCSPQQFEEVLRVYSLIRVQEPWESISSWCNAGLEHDFLQLFELLLHLLWLISRSNRSPHTPSTMVPVSFLVQKNFSFACRKLPRFDLDQNHWPLANVIFSVFFFLVRLGFSALTQLLIFKCLLTMFLTVLLARWPSTFDSRSFNWVAVIPGSASTVFSCPAYSSIGDLVTHALTHSLSKRPFEEHNNIVTQETCDPWDIWSGWWGDMTSPKKKTMTNTNTKTKMTVTKTNTFREHLQRATLENCDLWDIWSE